METDPGTGQEFNRFPFARGLLGIEPVFPEADLNEAARRRTLRVR
jgi:hypothetical protein